MRLFEEADAARDLIRNLESRQLELDVEGVEMGAVKDGDVGEGTALVDEAADALDDELGLLTSVDGLYEVGFFGVGAVGAEFFFEGAALGLSEEDAVGEGEDLGSRAVVGLDAVDDGAGVAVGKREDVFDVGSAPRVNALRIVADGHYAVVRADEIDDLGLDDVGILILVDEDVAETVDEVLAGGRGFLEEFEPVFEQVVVVEDVGGAFGLGVFFGEERDAFDDGFVLGVETRDGLGKRELGVARHREQRVQRARLGVGLVLEKSAVGRLDGVAQDAFGLLGVEDRKRAREADRFAVHAKGAMADAVKRAAPETSRLEAGELVNAVEHFLGGLVGEGEQEDFTGADALREEVGDAVGEGAGLAGTGAGEDEERAGLGGDGVILFVVEGRAEVDGRDTGEGVRERCVEGKIHVGGTRWPQEGAVGAKKIGCGWCGVGQDATDSVRCGSGCG